jgi:hypothetical protein
MENESKQSTIKATTLSTQHTLADRMAAALNCTTDEVKTRAIHDTHCQSSWYYLLNRPIGITIEVGNMIFVILETNTAATDNDVRMCLMWTPRQTNDTIISNSLSVGTLLWKRLLYCRIIGDSAVRSIPGCSSFLFVRTDRNTELLRTTDGESILPIIDLPFNNWMPPQTGLMSEGRTTRVDAHYYEDKHNGGAHDSGWLAIRVANIVHIYDVKQLLGVPLPYAAAIKSTNDGRGGGIGGGIVIPPVHIVEFDLADVTQADIMYAEWLHDNTTHNHIHQSSEFGRAGTWLVRRRRYSNSHDRWLTDLYLISGCDGSQIRRWNSPTHLVSWLESTDIHDACFTTATVTVMPSETKPTSAFHCESWTLSNSIISANNNGNPVIVDEDARDDMVSARPPPSGWTLHDGASVVMDIDLPTDHEQSRLTLMPKHIWLNHEWLAMDNKDDGKVSFYYLGHHADRHTHYPRRQNGLAPPLSVENQIDDDRDNETGLPYAVYDQVDFHRRALFMNHLTVPLPYVRAASEWIAVAINSSSTSSQRMSNGLLAIIYSYYFD